MKDLGIVNNQILQFFKVQGHKTIDNMTLCISMGESNTIVSAYTLYRPLR